MGYTWNCVRYPYPNRSVGSKSSCPISTATSSIITFPANSFTRQLYQHSVQGISTCPAAFVDAKH